MKSKKNQKGEKIKEMQEYKIVKNSYKGITLIALVITIVVLLILASVSIAMLTGDNGILTRAGDAKIETALGAVKEQIGLYQIEKKMNKQEVTAESLLAEGKVSRTVQAGDADKYYMYYALKENSFEGMQGLGKGNIASLKDVFLIDDNLNVKYIASNGKEYGDNLNNKVLEDETEIRFASKAFSEYVSKISGVAEDEMKFKWMKNQTSLEITDPNVDTLQDLIFFPNLVNLKLGNDFTGQVAPNITTMDGIENCSKLTNLTILYGPDKDYQAVSKLKNLKGFTRYGGSDHKQIAEQLSKNETLESFNITNQNIKNMSFIKKFLKLKRLTLNSCRITKMEGLENLTELVYLALETNEITKIEGIENLRNLITLDLWNNRISDITPISKNTSINHLNLQSNPDIDGNRNNYTGERLVALNKIGEILDKGGKIFLDLDKIKLFTNYNELNLSYKELTNLDVLEGLIELETLNLSGNKLTLEDEKSKEILKRMEKLDTLNLNNNKIINASVINELSKLKRLMIYDNDINLKDIEDIISNLNELRISQKTLETIVECNKEKINKLIIFNNNLTNIQPIYMCTDLVELSLEGNSGIKDFSVLANLSKLEKLNLKSTDLHGKNVNYSKMQNLRNLNLSNNTLWSEDLENLKSLRNNANLTIDLSNNAIIDATALLELNSNTIIYLNNNVNLSQESKDKLKAKFGNNVKF